MTPQINLYTTAGLNPLTGYGKLERGLLRGLRALGIEAAQWGPLSSSYPPASRGDPWVAPTAQARRRGTGGEGGSRRGGSVTHPSQGAPSLAPVTIVTAQPNRCMGEWLRGTRVLLYTMSESDRVSPEWVETINRTCDGVLVPCPALVGVYRASGVDVPVWDVGMGVDDPCFKPVSPSPAKRERGPGGEGPFIFLTYSYGDMRKGAHKAIQAFKAAFGDQPGFELWIKTRRQDANWLAGCHDRQVKVLPGDYTERQWLELLQRADCFVFPSYGEGFGLPPREATLAGTPAIATEWLGLWDVARWGLPLRVARLLPSQFDVWGANAEGSRWAEPDVEHLRELMEWVVNQPDRARRIAQAGRDYLLEHFTWEKTAERVWRVCGDLTPRPPLHAGEGEQDAVLRPLALRVQGRTELRGA